MSDYERLKLKLESAEFSGTPVGVLLNDAELLPILGIRTLKTFSASVAQTIDGAECLSLDELYADAGTYHSLTVGVDKDKELTMAVMQWALRVLSHGGQLVLVGEKRLGVQSFEKFLAQHLTGTAKLPLKDIGRLSFWEKNAQVNLPAENLWQENEILFGPYHLQLHSLPGVFARGELDAGTVELLAALELPQKGKVLDLACGNGIVGALALMQNPALAVTFTDDNSNAIASTIKTLKANKLNPAGVFCADSIAGLHKGERFELIALNPPFHNGQTTDYTIAERLMADADKILAPRGELYIVANKFCPYEKTLEKLFGKFEKLSEQNGFKVLRARAR